MTRFVKGLSALLIASAGIVAAGSAHGQADVTAEICTSAGVCAPVEPITALIIIGVKTVVDELNKGGKGFGPNGEILKAVNTVLNDLRQGGLGESNDLVRAFNTIAGDLKSGPGNNNDIVKALKAINIRL